jgi:glycosyltransferase domain-containing protein
MTDLTILLPLKGRHLHTLRFLAHADGARLPYRFLIADGQVDPTIASILDNARSVFPHLDIDYVRYADDRCYGDYFRKLADAAGRVRTRYMMQADNDDFLVRSGIDRCMAFLDANGDYASYGGGVGGFSLHPDAGALAKLTGVIQSLGSQYHGQYVHQDYTSPSAATRVRQSFAADYALFYSVFRAPALATICREAAEIDFGDLRAHETFLGARAKSLGKSRCDRGVMSYIRQRGTSQAAANMWGDMTAEVPEGEIVAFTDLVARIAADADGIDAAAFAAELRQLYTGIWQAELDERRRLQRNAEHAGQRRHAVREVLLSLVPTRAVALRRQWLRRAARQSIVNDLRRHGAPDDYVSTFRDELTAIEALLEGPGFGEFVRRHAPGLLGAERAAG